MTYLALEIGGTKLQLGVGRADGQLLVSPERRTVVPAAGAEGIRTQIADALPALLVRAGIERSRLRAVGIGFGGPVDRVAQTVIKSHQIAGWDGFPLGQWVGDLVGLPAVLGNDADVAGLAEARHGAGRGCSPVFYMTLGSGIGGGLIIDDRIYAGADRGAAEVGHLAITAPDHDGTLRRAPLELWASGWAIQNHARDHLAAGAASLALDLAGGDVARVTTQHVAAAAARGDALANACLARARAALAEAICHVITLLCPRRIILGGGVSLIGDALLFDPLRALVAERVFRPFAGLTQILPAALGEEVVLHGALALARDAHPPTQGR